MTDPNDLEILREIAKGNSKVIKQFYKNNLNYVKSYILENSGEEEDVEDVFQEAIIFLYQKAKNNSLKLNCTLQTYFYAICKNIWRNHLRKKRRLILEEEITEMPELLEASIFSELENIQRENLYRKYFLNLNKACKDILSLVFEGKRMKEIAKITGYTEGYARKKKFECKKALIEMIEKDPLYKEIVVDIKKR